MGTAEQSRSRKMTAVLRNAAMRIAGPDMIGRLWWRLRGRSSDHLRGDRKSRFEYMYRTGYWVQGQDGPLSGWGSSLEATRTIRDELPKLLVELGAKRLLDLGCGDFTWMRQVDLPCPYVGVDIVPEVIAANQREFGNETREFLVLDACEQALPAADVILCREVLFHLSFRDMEKLFANVRRSGARYFIATTNMSVSINLDIPSGEHSDRNLSIAPLNLGPPERTLWDGAVAQRVLGVWKLQ
jgi:SAM-dependent methyltransferase